jgi:hypothetical protein
MYIDVKYQSRSFYYVKPKTFLVPEIAEKVRNRNINQKIEISYKKKQNNKPPSKKKKRGKNLSPRNIILGHATT